MGIVLACVGSAVILLYCILIARYSHALSSDQADCGDNLAFSPIKVSVVVAVRNEIDTLPQLIEDLLQQRYPKEYYEVIFINDHSDDGTEACLTKVCREQKNFRMEALDAQFSGKKQAISRGCLVANGEWIIQTDADCRLPADFIGCHATVASKPGVLLAAGPVLIEDGRGLWNMLEALELMSLTGVGMASFLMGKPVMCSGANLSYSKALYEEEKEDLMSVPTASGDDIFLMLKAKKRAWGTAWIGSSKCLVTTSPTGGIRSFFEQRIRWGSKARHYSDKDLLILSVLVWMANAFLVVYLTGSFFSIVLFRIFIVSLVVKSLVEFSLLYKAARIFGRQRLLSLFPAAAIFHYIYITVAGLFSMTGRYVWKGRSFKAQQGQWL
jgi:cellulose synthase/poly-beta-1,6-N-acetylglucosamine synthase-like glycosyltransferase